MRPRRSTCAPMPGARRRRNPAASMIAPSARSPASRSASKSAASGASVALVSQTAQSQARRSRRSSARSWSSRRSTIRSCVIAEFTAPATLADRGQQPSLRVNWSKAPQQRGRPAGGAAARLHRVRRSRASTASTAVGADAGRARQACRAARPSRRRLAARSSRDRDACCRSNSGSMQGVHPVLAEPFDADVRAKLTGLKDFAPKPWPERFREIAGRRRPGRDRAVARSSRAR